MKVLIEVILISFEFEFQFSAKKGSTRIQLGQHSLYEKGLGSRVESTCLCY
jgi:hypothetical protein